MVLIMSLLEGYKGPKLKNLIKPTLDALKELDGSGQIDEINDRVINNLNLTEEIIEYPHGINKSSTELEYQISWARTALKRLRLAINTKNKVWVLTYEGQTCVESNETLAIKHNLYLRELEERRKKIKEEELAEGDEETSLDEDVSDEDLEENWRTSLKKILLTLDPYDFEKLAQIVLRESGFMEVEITKKSGDGGFDGKGILRMNKLVSIPIIFECKRYKDAVGAERIRNFRGAMEGRANRGLFITTSTFTRGAKEEATREGATLIDLINAEGFIDLIKDLGLGVNVRKVEKVEINREWFTSFQSIEN